MTVGPNAPDKYQLNATDTRMSKYPELCFREGVWRESVNRGDQHFIPQDLPLLDNVAL